MQAVDFGLTPSAQCGGRYLRVKDRDLVYNFKKPYDYLKLLQVGMTFLYFILLKIKALQISVTIIHEIPIIKIDSCVRIHG